MGKNRALKTLFIVNGMFVLAGNLLGPLYAIYVETLGVGIMAVSLSWSVMMCASILGTLIVAKLGDSVKESEYLLMAGYLLRTGAWISLALITSLPQLLIVQAIIGLGEAVGTPAFDAIFAKHLSKGKIIREYSGWKIVSNIVVAVAVMVGGFIVTRLGFDLLFCTMSLLALSATYLVWITPRKLL